MDISLIGNTSLNPAQFTLATALSKLLDSIDVGKMSNGGAKTVFSAITATTTSDEITVGADGFKHVAIYLEGSAFTAGNFAFSLTGAAILGGNYGAINKQKEDGSFTPVTIPSINANGNVCYIIPNIGVNFIKITATRTTDGALTAYAVPFN